MNSKRRADIEMISISEINEVNQRSWEHENMLRERRMKDPAIQEVALRTLADEQLRGLPTYYQTTLEKSLADAEYAKQRFLSQQGRKGGQAKRFDPLQQAILDLVRSRPGITHANLRDLLTRERFPGLIDDVDETNIYFVQPDGRLKESPLSGLKHRLSRAKKTLKSR